LHDEGYISVDHLDFRATLSPRSPLQVTCSQSKTRVRKEFFEYLKKSYKHDLSSFSAMKRTRIMCSNILTDLILSSQLLTDLPGKASSGSNSVEWKPVTLVPLRGCAMNKSIHCILLEMLLNDTIITGYSSTKPHVWDK